MIYVILFLFSRYRFIVSYRFIFFILFFSSNVFSQDILVEWKNKSTSDINTDNPTLEIKRILKSENIERKLDEVCDSYYDDENEWRELEISSDLHVYPCCTLHALHFLDGTFYDKNEIHYRDVLKIPHPFISESLKIFSELDTIDRQKIFFTHFNHTNPILNRASLETKFLCELVIISGILFLIISISL